MASNRPLLVGPVALSNTTTTNIFNPPTTTGGVGVSADITATVALIRHVRISNKTSAPVSVSLWLGATGANAAGTEFLWTGYSVPANSYVDAYGGWRITSSQFIVGGAGAATSLTFEADGEIGVQ
jgi:hypothetical protein